MEKKDRQKKDNKCKDKKSKKRKLEELNNNHLINQFSGVQESKSPQEKLEQNPEEAINEKLEKNRESARNSRIRKKIYIELLENKVEFYFYYKLNEKELVLFYFLLSLDFFVLINRILEIS